MQQVDAICQRFSRAVGGYDWRAIEPRLAERPVRVDIGVACLQLGALSDRRFLASRLTTQLIECADTVMYRAKADPDENVKIVCLAIERGELVETGGIADDNCPTGAGPDVSS